VASQQPSGILDGLRVLELSAFVAAPLGGASLAAMGADVVRVDPVGGGIDAQRQPRDDTKPRLPELPGDRAGELFSSVRGGARADDCDRGPREALQRAADMQAWKDHRWLAQAGPEAGELAPGDVGGIEGRHLERSLVKAPAPRGRNTPGQSRPATWTKASR